MRLLIGSLGIAAVAASLVSCGSAAGPKDVCISTTFCATNFVFTPTAATRTTGATVAWGNNANVTHNVTFDNASSGLTGGDVAPGAILTVTINSAGTYPFHCAIHPQMKGTITIQ